MPGGKLKWEIAHSRTLDTQGSSSRVTDLTLVHLSGTGTTPAVFTAVVCTTTPPSKLKKTLAYTQRTVKQGVPDLVSILKSLQDVQCMSGNEFRPSYLH